MAVHIVEEAERCLNCKRPMCQERGCPVKTPIPKVIQLFKEHEMAAAGEMLFENNPMSAVCALVCNHAAQCEGNCVLGRKGSPVHFSAIESYLSETYLDRMRVERAEPNGHKVAVIGSGPAGITAAVKLAKAGCDVTIFEKSARTGGVLEYGIPEFRLSKKLVARYGERLKDMGVSVRPNAEVGDALRIEDLMRDGYEAVFVGTGAGRAKKLGTPGETRADVHFGVDYLVDPSAYSIGERVAVIGAGNVAMDVARTAFRHGAREVTLYARSKRISANGDEVEYAQLDGAVIAQGMAIQGINDEGPYFKRAVFDADDKVNGYEDGLVQEQADTTFICVSQMPKNKLVLSTPGLEADDQGRLVVDEKCMTTVPGVFAAGDVVLGPKYVVHAVEGAKRAAVAMLEYLGVA